MTEKPRTPRTLLWQLAVSLLVVQIAAAAVFGWYGYSRLVAFHHQRALEELQRLTPLVLARGADFLGEADLAGLAEVVRQDAAAGGVRITVVGPDGRVLADSQADAAGMENHASRPEIAAALARGQGSEIRFSRTVGADMLYFAVPLVEDGQVKAVIRTAKPLTGVNRELDRLLRALFLAGGASLAMTFVVILLVSRRTSASVASIARSAQQFASGDWSHRLPMQETRELADLVDALNAVADQLTMHINQLQLQRNEQQAIVQSMSTAVLALDREQRILSVNRAAERMLGMLHAGVRGRLLQEVMRQPELNRFVAAAMHLSAETTAEFVFEGQVEAVIQAISQPLLDARQRPVGLLVLLNDITDLRRLETIRSDFVANVSHELRTPITNIKGYVETMMQVGVEDRQQTLRFLDIVRRNSDRLASIIDDLLSLARLEQPDTKATLELIETPVRRIVAAAVGQHDAAAESKSIEVILAVPDDMMIRANPQLLEQALGNLLSNAVKYSPARTRVTVSARPLTGGVMELAVADEGPGIDARHLPRIFERFYRVDKARSRELGGTGLGLAIVKHIALAHGGRVEVESQVGKGSVFRLLIPNPP